MRYLALATDFDGTLTSHGRMATATVEALERVRASGRRLLLVSGRRLEDLVKVQPRLDLFDGLILENGAVLHWPATGKTELQCRPVPAHFTQMLRRRGVRPLDVGRVLVATCHPHEAVVLEAIYELGLELQVVFNGDAVMILPPNVNKGTGLQMALRALGLSRHEVVGIGDAANDHSFFAVCDCAVATANAIPGLKEEAAFTTAGADGAGVVELAEALVADDLRQRLAGREEQELLLGTLSDGTPWWVHPRDVTLLVAGPSGGGKSTFAAGLIEQLVDHAYQVCVVDPEGDYDTLPGLVSTGSRLRPPVIPEVAGLLDHVSSSVSVNLIGMPLSDRPGFFEQLMPRLMTMRAHTGPSPLDRRRRGAPPPLPGTAPRRGPAAHRAGAGDGGPGEAGAGGAAAGGRGDRLRPVARRDPGRLRPGRRGAAADGGDPHVRRAGRGGGLAPQGRPAAGTVRGGPGPLGAAAPPAQVRRGRPGTEELRLPRRRRAGGDHRPEPGLLHRDRRTRR